MVGKPSCCPELPPLHTIPVIIITGKPPVPEEISQYGILIEDYIVKPVDFSRIVQSLHHIIEIDRDMKREINRIKTEFRIRNYSVNILVFSIR